MRLVEDEPRGVVVPPELAGLVDLLLGVGLGTIERRDGALPPTPGLEGLRIQLRVTAAAARGTRQRMVVPTAQPSVTYLTVGEAAEVMGLKPRRVRQLAAAGILIARKHGRDWQIDSESAHDRRRRTWQQEAA